MKTLSRRSFIKNSSLVTSGALLLPQFLKGSADAFGKSNGHKRLIIIQLGGGNDGLNNIIPFRDDLYYQNRPKIGLKADQLLPTDSDFAFHHKLKGLRDLYDQGYLTIINSVGYPNPNRSHFRSMDIWHSASNSDEYLSTGWIGRYLDANCEKPHLAIESDDMLSLAMKGERLNGLAIRDINKFMRSLRDPELRRIVREEKRKDQDDNKVFLYKTMGDTYSSSEYLNTVNRSKKRTKEYPNSAFGRQLKSISQLILGGSETKVYYTSLGGFDTHFAQLARQERLLADLSNGVSTLVADLKSNGEWEHTAIMCFSEFGRRVKENASLGTDHGTANVVYLISPKLNKAGLYNVLPDLSILDAGDLKYQVDFRSIYADLLRDWLGANPQNILKGSYDKLNLFT